MMEETFDQEDCPRSDAEALAVARAMRCAREAERSALATRVEELFGTVTKRFRPPTRTGCRIVAGVLLMMRDADQSTHRKRVSRAPSGRQKARRAAKCFLAALQTLREQREKSIENAEFSLMNPVYLFYDTARSKHFLDSSAEVTTRYITIFNAEISRIDEAVRAIEDVILFFPEEKREAGLDLLPLLVTYVHRAWRFTNGGTAPRGKNPHDPLVKFITAALPGNYNLDIVRPIC